MCLSYTNEWGGGGGGGGAEPSAPIIYKRAYIHTPYLQRRAYL